MINKLTASGTIIFIMILLIAIIITYFSYENDKLKDQIITLEINNEKLNEVIENRNVIIDLYEKQFEIASEYVNEKTAIENHYYKTVKEREIIIKDISNESDKIKMAKKAELFNNIFRQMK